MSTNMCVLVSGTGYNELLSSPASPKAKVCVVEFNVPGAKNGGTDKGPNGHRIDSIPIANGVIAAGRDGGAYPSGLTFITPDMVPHGPSRQATSRARGPEAGRAPALLGATDVWFQFETCLQLSLTEWADRRRDPSWASRFGLHDVDFDPAGA